MIDEEQRQVPDHKSVVTAYLTQALYEECHSRLLQKVLHMYPNLPIIFTGGCTLNCPANTNAVINSRRYLIHVVMMRGCPPVLLGCK